MNASVRQAELRSATGEVLALQGLSVAMAVRDLAVEVQSVQRYRNPGPRNVEVVYTFPLPAGAVLLEVEASLGERVLTGTVVEKKRAERDYEQAIAEGHSAILLQEAGEGLHTLNLGNLMAGEEAAIRLRHASLASWSGNTVRLLLPGAIAPRYGDPLAAGLEPHQVPEASLAAEYPLSIDVRIEGLLARARVECPSHAVALQASDGTLEVKLARKGFLDRDFVLDFTFPEAAASSAQAAPDGAGSVALASFRPALPAKHAGQALALKLVVDCSGSMAGDSIAQARAALARIMDLLEPRDSFDVTVFGSTCNHLFPTLRSADRGALEAARRFVHSIDANLGGTEMAAALNAAFALPGESGSADVLLVTDGEIWQADALVERAAKARQRVFVVGVGSAVSEAFLRRLALATGGACELVSPREDIAARIVAQFRRMRAPRATRAQVRWPAAPAWSLPLPQSLFAGDTVHLFAGFDAPVAGEARLELEYPDGTVLTEAARLADAAPAFAADLPRLAAAKRLAGAGPEEGLRLALAYRLVSPYTHTLMVAWRAEGEREEDLPDLHVVPQMLAAGWGGTGSVIDANCVDLSFARRTVMDQCSVSTRDLDLSWLPPPEIVALDALFEPRLPTASPEPQLVLADWATELVAALNVRGRSGTTGHRFWALVSLPALRGILPAELLAWLEGLVKAGWPEMAVVAALLSTVADSPAGERLSRPARRAVFKAVVDAKPAKELLELFHQTMAEATRADSVADL